MLHSIDAEAPRPYRRKAAPTFVIAIAELKTIPEDRVELLRVGYPLLVRALANLCVMVTDGPDGLVVRFVTLEQGVYGVGPGLPDDPLARLAFARIEPLAASQLVIANDFVTDLPEPLWQGDEQTAQMLRRRTRARSARPPARAVPHRGHPRTARSPARRTALRHRRALLRQRERATSETSLHGVPDPDGPVYWMSASGVDKADLRLIGEHILLVAASTPNARRWCSAFRPR